MTRPFSPSTIASNIGAWVALVVLTMFASPFVLHAQQENCCQGGAKIRSLVLQYTGDDCTATHHNQDPSKVFCDGNPANASPVQIIVNNKSNPDDGNKWFDGTVSLGESFTVAAANGGKSELSADTWVHIYDNQHNLLQRIRFHTSCSQPIAAGNQFGSILVVQITLTNDTQCGIAPPPCQPCDDGGKIEGDEFSCGPFDPAKITESEAPACNLTPPPPPVDCCADGNKIAKITMTYTGQDCSATSHSQDPSKVSCSGDPAGATTVVIIASEKQGGTGKIWFSGQVNLHESFVIDAANAGEDRLKAETWVDVKSTSGQLLQRIRFHTSCSQPLATGDQFGSLQVNSIVLEDGSTCGETPPADTNPDCCDLGGKPKAITMTYTGQDCSATSHSQDPSKVTCSGDPANAASVVIIASEKQGGTGKIWFSGQVNLHESFVIDAANAGEDRLKAETWVDVKSTSGQLLQRIRFHTSCSQPLATGDQFGSLQVKSIVLEDGSTCGETPPADTNPDCCDLGGKPKAITMTYTGQDCSATSHSQDPSKVTCSGDPANAASVVIIASEKQGGAGKIWFSGQVNLHESFVIDAANAGEDRLKAETWVDVKSTSGQLLQRIHFHTSCSQPLATGDQFGSLRVEQVLLDNGQTCSPPSPPPAPELEYQWLMAFNGCPTNLSQAIPGATEAEYDPPYTKVTTWFVRLARPKDCSGDDDAWVASNCVVKRVVNVEINFSDVSCHDNDTFDPADDTWRFMLIVTGSGSGWTATGSNGAGVFQLDGSYGVPVQLGPFKISDGPITLEAKDKDHPQCKTSATLMPPAPCSSQPPKASLGDFVWNDLNKNGRQDPGEPGVDGITVTLHKCDGTVVAQQTTSNGGQYLFTDLAPNMHYYVVFSDLPNNFAFTSQDVAADALDSDVDPATGRTACTFLSPGEEDRTWDAGIFEAPPPLGKIGDYVWFDANGNGIQEPDEQGMSGIFVILEDCFDNFLAFTITDANGMYMFSDLQPGDYVVRFANPGPGYFGFPIELTLQNAGINDTKDSDADWLGSTDCITLGPGEVNLTIDAGFTAVEPQCTLLPEVSDIDCHDNGTPQDPSDDTYTFTLTVNGIATADWGYDIAETGEQMLPYGVPHPMGPFPIADGQLTLHLCDHDINGCCTTVTISPPPPCSQGVCDNVTNGGTIGHNESKCGPYDPEPIVNLEAPIGGSGPIEYVWLSSTEGCPWDMSQAIPDSNSPTYDPSQITQTTWFLRCARRVGCDTFIESNCVVKEVVSDCGSGCHITIEVATGTITIGGLQAPNVIVHVFDASSWATVFKCFNNCSNPQVVGNLPGGTYYVKAELFDSSWNLICDRKEFVSVPGEMITVPVGQGAVASSSEGLHTNTSTMPADRTTPLAPPMALIERFAVVPNPASDFARVLWEPTADASHIEIVVMNALGQVVESIVADGSTGMAQLDLSTCRSGTYLVQLRTKQAAPIIQRLIIGR